MTIIITDSTSDISGEDAKKMGIIMLSLTVNFGSESYIDKVTISNKQFYEKLSKSDSIPSTSLLNPDDFLRVFKEHPKDDFVIITLSSKLSGTYQSAMIAKEIEERENIHVIDSGTVTIGLRLLVEEAVEMLQNGASTEEIVHEINHIKEKVRIVAIVDTLKYLVKGGRLSAVSGVLGTALNMKPVITVYDGEIHTLAKIRGNKAANKEVKNLVDTKYLIDQEKSMLFAHSNDEAKLSEFRREVPYKGDAYMIGSVVGTHAGPGAVAIAYFEK